jgi:hypothetical protein
MSSGLRMKSFGGIIYRKWVGCGAGETKKVITRIRNVIKMYRNVSERNVKCGDRIWNSILQ